MARNIKILRARIELQDGEMTAVHSTKKNHQQNQKTAATGNTGEKANTTAKEHPQELEQPMLTAGILHLLANVQKSRLLK